VGGEGLPKWEKWVKPCQVIRIPAQNDGGGEGEKKEGDWRKKGWGPKWMKKKELGQVVTPGDFKSLVQGDWPERLLKK